MSDEIYISIDEIPLDQWDGTDGDNSVLADGPVPALRGLESVQPVSAPKKAAPKFVPFRRQVKLGKRGNDVKAIKRALAVAGFGKWNDNPTALFGPFAVKNLKAFQKKNNLKADGVYGKDTHRKLARYFDRYGVWLLMHTRVPSSSGKQRDIIVATAIYGYQHRWNIHYTQTSLRMQGVRNRLHPPSYPNWEDCSSYSTWCYWVSGASDPNGFGYNGEGYTGTLANHGHAISVTQLQPGDLIFYGGGFPYHHVAVYIGHGRVISHGSESGPLLLSYNYRSDIRTIRSYF